MGEPADGAPKAEQASGCDKQSVIAKKDVKTEQNFKENSAETVRKDYSTICQEHLRIV
jgi:hypothetical protein